jgi:hypothetical protein
MNDDANVALKSDFLAAWEKSYPLYDDGIRIRK